MAWIMVRYEKELLCNHTQIFLFFFFRLISYEIESKYMMLTFVFIFKKKHNYDRMFIAKIWNKTFAMEKNSLLIHMNRLTIEIFHHCWFLIYLHVAVNVALDVLSKDITNKAIPDQHDKSGSVSYDITG